MAGAKELGLQVDPKQAALFARHAELLLQWNRKINLTAIVEPVEVAVKHVLDAIAPCAHIPANGRLLDIGTGGGFPGVPLKIMRPHQPMVLIDAVRKKVNFLRHVVRELQLDDIEVRHTRAEDLAREAGNQFEVIVCRAVASLPQIVGWAHPLLAPGGRIIAYRGPRLEQGERPEARLSLAHGTATYRIIPHKYRLPCSGDRRTAIVLQIQK